MTGHQRALFARAKPTILTLVILQTLFLAGLAQAGQGTEKPTQLLTAPTSSNSTYHQGVPSLQLSSSKIAQDQSGSGGGEGKPEDWDSPSKLRLNPTYHETWTVRGLWPTLLNLFSWWL